MMYIYGSYCIKHWFDDYPKAPRDIDVVLLEEGAFDDQFDRTLDPDLAREIVIAPFFSTIAHLSDGHWLTPEGMLTLKMSHAHIDEHWWKSIEDIQFLQSKGVTYDRSALLEIRKHWNRIHAGKRQRMDFRKTPEEFFNSQVTRWVNHDELHDALRLGDVPAYTRILANDTTVEVSRERFESLPAEHQLHTVIEEVAVLACERHYAMKDPRAAYREALRDFVTRMTNGWYNLYVLENITPVLEYNTTNIYENMSKIMTYLNHKANLGQYSSLT